MPHPDLVPSGPALAHIDGLIARTPGLTRTRVARLAGVSHALIGARARPTMTRDTHERLLAVTDRHARLAPVKVPASVVVRHVERLFAEVPHATQQGVAEAAGLTAAGLNYIMRGRYPGVRAATAVRVCSVTAEDLTDATTYVPRARTLQQVRSMSALGWSYGAQSALLDGAVDVEGIVKDSRHLDRVSRRIAALIDDLYRRVGDTPGPDTRTATWARKAGWHTPICYDDNGDLIPGAVPDRTVLAWETHSAARERLAAVALLLDRRTPRDIAARYGHSRDWPTTLRMRVGLRIDYDPAEGTLTIPDGQDVVVAAIRAAVEGIDYTSVHDHHDEPDIDYVTRWEALRAGGEDATGERVAA